MMLTKHECTEDIPPRSCKRHQKKQCMESSERQSSSSHKEKLSDKRSCIEM